MSRLGVFLPLAAVTALLLPLSGRLRDPPDPQAAEHLPATWQRASTDPDKGGRFLPDRNQALRRFQEEVRESDLAIPNPHYGEVSSVVFAVSSRLPLTDQRLRTLLQREAADPGMSIVLLSEQPPALTAARLGLGAGLAGGRITHIHVAGRYGASPSFPFVRDYAPILRVRLRGEHAEPVEIVPYRASPLVRVVDPVLQIVRRRSADQIEDRYALTRQLADVYADRLAVPVASAPVDVRMDGGNLLSDGRGTCFATKAMLAANRGGPERVARALRDAFGCARAVFLTPPRHLEEAEHVDTLLFFADPENVILSMPSLYASDLEAERENLGQLLDLGYKVHRVPRQTASITYANILATHSHVYVPQYTMYAVESPGQQAIAERVRRLDRARDRDELAQLLRQPVRTTIIDGGKVVKRDNDLALAVLARLFPDRTLVPVNSDETIGSLGSWHCLSHELPGIAPIVSARH